MKINKNPEAFNHILSKIPDLHNKSVLDIFAREGDWQSFNLNNKVKKIEAWEIDKKFIPKLKKNLPDAIIKCHDSIEYLKNHKLSKSEKFDILIIDNPLNCYGKNYCEHFNVIKNVKNVIKNDSFVIFNVVLKPFNYELFPQWKSYRELFYETNKTSKMSLKFMKDFYTKIFEKQGFRVKSVQL